MSFADNVKKLMSENKVKLATVCRESGIAYPTLNSILNRDTDVMSVSVQIPIRLSEYFNVSVYDLIGVDPPELEDKKATPDEIRGDMMEIAELLNLFDEDKVSPEKMKLIISIAKTIIDSDI